MRASERLHKVGERSPSVSMSAIVVQLSYLNFSRSKSEWIWRHGVIRKLEGDNPDINIAEYVDAGTSKHQTWWRNYELNLDSSVIKPWKI